MDTKEYAITFTSDWTWDVVHELGEYCGMPIKDDVLEIALDEDDNNLSNKIVKFYDPQNTNNLIVVCCFNDDIFHYLVVRCDLICSEKIKNKLLEIDTKIRLAAMQEVQKDLTDLSNSPENGLAKLEKDYQISF